MVIDNFDIKGIIIVPIKTNSPLVIDSNAVSAFSVAMQRF